MAPFTRQPVKAEHLRYIDYALDYCDATDNYPESAKSVKLEKSASMKM